MTTMLRLILLIVLAVFFSQSCGYTSTTYPIYTYDASGHHYIDRNIESESQKPGYDERLDFDNPSDGQQLVSIDITRQMGSFFALLDSFLLQRE